jgi:hypothetical protein
MGSLLTSESGSVCTMCLIIIDLWLTIQPGLGLSWPRLFAVRPRAFAETERNLLYSLSRPQSLNLLLEQPNQTRNPLSLFGCNTREHSPRLIILIQRCQRCIHRCISRNLPAKPLGRSGSHSMLARLEIPTLFVVQKRQLQIQDMFL